MALTCVAGDGYGRRLQSSAKHVQLAQYAPSLEPLSILDTLSKSKSLTKAHPPKSVMSMHHPSKLFALILLLFHPAASFNPSKARAQLGFVHSTHASSLPEVSAGQHCIGHTIQMSASDVEDRSPMRGACRFFLDTADIKSWEELLPLGLFHGVTTNPTILQRAGVPCTIEAICKLAETAFALGADEFMAQAWGGSAESLFQIGLQLRAIDPHRVVIKVPVTASGVQAATRLAAEEGGTRICLTACYDSTQALIAASAGVEYLAPYLGRMTDAGKDGMHECKQMQEIVKGLGASTRILVASIRDVASMASLAASGLDTFTFSPDIARALFAEPLTEAAAKVFEDAASGTNIS